MNLDPPPVIGLTCSRQAAPERYYVSEDYARAVAAAGGLPVLLPPVGTGRRPPGGQAPQGLEAQAAAILRRLDGLVLTGGGDVDPAWYGEEPLPALGPVDPARDGLEMALARLAWQQDMPVLGICRGLQVMVVALGGSLYQDLPSQLPGAQRHQWDTARNVAVHPVQVKPGSRLAELLGRAAVDVNSFHHQAAKAVPAALQVTALSPDGVVEGLEAPERRFWLAVQWHPENLWEDDPQFFALFRALVFAAGGGRLSS